MTYLAAISTACLGLCCASASAQPSDDASVSGASAQGGVDTAINPEPDEATKPPSPPETAPTTETPRTRTRRGEVFSDIYIGVAVTTDASIKLDGVVQEESLLCGAECSSTKSPVGGLRIGWFVEKFPWLGVAGDLSFFIQSWAIQSPYEVSVIPVSALLMFRAPLVRSAEHPNGRAQPYLALGPSLIISRAKLAEGLAAIGTARVETDTTADAGFDGRIGMRLIASSWISVVLEYRVTVFWPTWNLRGRRVETSVWTNHFNIGLGIHY